MAVGTLGYGNPWNGSYGYRQMAMFQAPLNGAAGYPGFYGENVALTPRARVEAFYDRSYQGWNELAYGPGGMLDYNRIQQMNFGAFGQIPNFSMTGPNTMQLAQQFNQVYGPMQSMENEMLGTSVQQFGQLKEEIFQNHHYEFTNEGPVLRSGRENPQARARRLQWERRQTLGVERQFANHPANQRIRQLEAQVQAALRSGQNPTQLLLELDSVKTQFGIEKARALMTATSPRVTSGNAWGANDQVRALLDFGHEALNDYGGLHRENMQRLASDPATQAYLNALAAQQRQMGAYLGSMAY